MKTIHIVGTGMNSVTEKAQAVIESCEVLFGAARLLESFSGCGKPMFPEYTPEGVRRVIEIPEFAKTEKIAVLVSGDVGFYSGARALIESFAEYDVRLTAGVSTVCEFFAKIKIPWQDAALVSMHANAGPLVSAVRRNKYTFCLTGGNTRKIGRRLEDAGFGGLTVHIGENLGYPEETIKTVTAAELYDTSAMTVLVIENERFDASVPTGFSDDTFIRAQGVPMTKSEVRAVVLSKLRLTPDSICYDIGAGTGSVAAEMALSAYNGHVYAIERKHEAAELILENCKKHHIGNVTVVEGVSPGALIELPAPEAVFIGGGFSAEVMSMILSKNKNAKIVTTAIALETAYRALEAYEGFGICDTEILQINVSRAVKRGEYHLLTAQNPIFIISGGGL